MNIQSQLGIVSMFKHFKRPMSRYAFTIPLGVLVGLVAAFAAYKGIVPAWTIAASVLGFAVALSENADRRIVIAIDEGRVSY